MLAALGHRIARLRSAAALPQAAAATVATWSRPQRRVATLFRWPLICTPSSGCRLPSGARTYAGHPRADEHRDSDDACTPSPPVTAAATPASGSARWGWEPYLQLMRWDKPIGSWLLYIPCTWSITMASGPGQLPDLPLLGLFAVGAVAMRGAGCTINDMWDADIDRKVARTATRPLAAGTLSYTQAWALLAAQLSVGLAVLLQLNEYSIILGASSLGLVATYPLMKRITFWPQAFLGLVFNWGAMVGWSAVQGGCDWSVVLPLYAAGISWTLYYDTIYACQDKEDDVLIGVKSTALLFQDRLKPFLAATAAATSTGWLAAGVASAQPAPYFVAVAAASALLARQIATLDPSNTADCLAKFKQNKWIGLSITAGAAASLIAPS